MAPYYPDSSVQDLDKLLSQSKGTRTRLEPSWLLNLAYYNGNQWVFWNRGRLDRPRLDASRITLTDNRIIGIVRTELAKMTKQKPAWQVTPTSAQDEDLQAALMGEKVLDYLWRSLHMRNHLVDALLWSRICTAGFWKIVWDSAKGQQVQIVADQQGQPVMHAGTGAPMKPEHFEGQMPEGLQAKTIATGDVHVESVSPFEMYVDPIPHEFEDLEWCIQVAIKSTDYVKQHFDVEITPDAEVSSGTVESRMFPSAQEAGTSQYKGVKLNEYWCKPNSQHPNGRRAVWASGKMLFEDANPYGCLPYVMFKGIPIPGRFWPTTVTEQLRGPQTELNKIRSQIVENAQRLGNPAIMCSKQANVSYSGVPGERIDYDSTVQDAAPQYLAPPPMPQYVLQQQEKIEQSMQEISGQHEVSNAQVPAGVKAASAINLLQEADDTRLGPAIYDMEETLGVAGGMLLKLVAKYWTDERTIIVAGKDHALDAMSFRGAALKENTQVEVQAGSAFPQSKAAKQAAIQDQLGLYFQYMGQQPMNKRMLGKVLEDLEAGALAKLFGDISKDEGQINRENQQISQGEPLPINVYDDHEAHVEGHTEFQKGPTYIGLGPIVAQVMERHVAEHRRQIAQAAGPPPHQSTPAESLAYKDAPPDIRRQIEAQAGMTPSHEKEPTPMQQQGATNGSQQSQGKS
jgi:hypothetical protein